MNKLLTIVIVTHNSEQHLSNCLESIKIFCSALKKEIVIVDNASTDNTLAIANRYSGNMGIKVIAGKINLGFARANNLGSKQSSGEFILFLNPDTAVTEGSLEAMMDYLENNGTCGCLGPKLVYPDGSLQLSCRMFINIRAILCSRIPLFKRIFDKSKFIDRNLMKDFDHNEVRAVDWLLGACLMMSRNVFEKLGGWDERFRLYFEDVDLCHSLNKMGFRTIYFPESTVIHYHQRDSAKRFSWKTIWHIQSAVKYFNKNGWSF